MATQNWTGWTLQDPPVEGSILTERGWELALDGTNPIDNLMELLVAIGTPNFMEETVPSAVSNLAVSQPTTTGGQLTWSLPSNGGSVITSQRIERSPAGADTWTTLTDVLLGTITNYTDTTAAPSTQYDYRHRSTNAVGNSAYSNVVTITTTSSATVPSAVSNLALSTPTVAGGTLTWTPPSNGGSAITSQRIERKLTSNSTWSVLTDVLTGSATSYTDTTADASNQYDYRHRSTNAVGNSAYSNIVTITTTSSTTVPSAVSNLALPSPTLTGGTLTWTLPSNGGAAITAQRIERSPAGANNWTTLSSSIAGSATTYTDSTANAGTAYDYRHRSTNAVGNSAYSNIVTVTTAAVLDLYAEFSADTNLTTVTFSENFLPTDIAAGTINKNWNFLRTSPTRRGTKVYFSSTGTLPPPLQPNTPYYLSNDASVITVYPVASQFSEDNATPLFPVDDTMLPADYLIMQRGAITLTNGGSGTHTCTTQLPMVTDWADKTNGKCKFARGATDLNELPLRSTVSGFPALYFEGFLTRDPDFGQNESNGKLLSLDMLGANTRLQMAQYMCDKRFIYSISVVQLDDNLPAPQITKLVMATTAFNTTNGQITRSNHFLQTGYPVIIRAWNGAVPTGFTNGSTYFARRVSSTVFTLHPTLADANNNTSIIIPSNQGSGDIVIYDPFDAITAQERSFFYTIDEPVGTSQHLIAPAYTEESESGILARLPANVSFGWINGNGEIREVLRNDAGFDGKVIPVRLSMAPQATIPTGLARNTTYYAVRTNPSSSANRVRLFNSQSNAQAWINAGYPSAVQTGQIVPTANFEGLVRWVYADNFVRMQNSTSITSAYLIQKDQILVHAVLIDTNNPDAGVTTQLYSSGINGSLTNIHNAIAFTGRTKGVYNAANARTNQNIILANAAQPHRAGHLYMFEFMYGASNSDPTAQLIAKIQELIAKYNIVV